MLTGDALTHDTHDARGKASDRGANVLGENRQSELLGLAPAHQQHTSHTIRNLRSVATGSSPVTPLRERRTNLGQRLLGAAAPDTIILGDGNANALLLGSRVASRGGSAGRELVSLDGHDFVGEAAGGLSRVGALVGLGCEVVHTLAGDVKLCERGAG
jgi:hypothetical protein